MVSAAERRRRRHLSAVAWASGLTVLLGLLDTGDMSERPPLQQLLTLLAIFVLAFGFWEIVHIVTGDKLLGKDRDGE
jgi:hypothetical protein